MQLYVTPPRGERHRPVRELKAFAKVSLQPGESKDVQFTLDKRSFAYYEPELHDFYAESGTYQICVGASSRDLRLTGSLEWQAAPALSYGRVPMERCHIVEPTKRFTAPQHIRFYRW